MSYAPEDIPECYFLCPEFDVAKLESRVLQGIQGISGNARAIMQFFKGVLVIMKGTTTEQLNNLSRVQYDNPHYMASKGQDAYHRLLGGSNEFSNRLRIRSMAKNVVLKMLEMSGSSVKGDELENNELGRIFKLENNISKTELFAKSPNLQHLAQNLFQYIVDVFPELQKFPYQQFFDLVKQHLTNMQGLEGEKEWRVKPEYQRQNGEIKQMPVLKIHDGAILWADESVRQPIEQSQLSRIYQVQIFPDKEEIKRLAIYQTSNATFEQLTSLQYQNVNQPNNYTRDFTPSYAQQFINKAQNYQLQPQQPAWQTA
jgi:hypothetical protein